MGVYTTTRLASVHTLAWITLVDECCGMQHPDAPQLWYHQKFQLIPDPQDLLGMYLLNSSCLVVGIDLLLELECNFWPFKVLTPLQTHHCKPVQCRTVHARTCRKAG